MALCGEQFGKRPSVFDEASSRLSAQVVHVGFAEPEMYRKLLWEAAVTISTAHHEFFGISILEAIYCQTFPILPEGLSYPELIPDRFHEYCLYQEQVGLLKQLRWALGHGDATAVLAAELAEAVTILIGQSLHPVMIICSQSWLEWDSQPFLKQGALGTLAHAIWPIKSNGEDVHWRYFPRNWQFPGKSCLISKYRMIKKEFAPGVRGPCIGRFWRVADW